MNSRPDAARPNRAASSLSIADVAVIGGGIVGAAAALAAAQAGLATVWVAGRPSQPLPAAADDRDLRVYALSPSTRRFLEGLRIWSQLDPSRTAPVFDMRVFGDAAGHAALHFGAYESATERLATIVEHRELARALDAACGYFPGIERIEGLATSVEVGDEAVAVVTERGMRHARLVIAADGAQSPTRDAVGIRTRGKPYHQRALVGNFACARPHGGTAWQWFTDDGVIALLPLGGGDAMSLVWSAPDAKADDLVHSGSEAIASRLSAMTASLPGTGPGALTALGAVVAIPLALQTAQRLVARRTALVGDAAHVIHPLAGQGLNLGLADVETLLAIVTTRESFRDCGDATLLRRYERARAEPVLAMRQMTDGLSRLFGSARPEAVHLRGVGLRILDRVAPLKRLLMRQAAGGP